MKRTAARLVGAAALLCVAGCGGSGSTTSAPASTPATPTPSATPTPTPTPTFDTAAYTRRARAAYLAENGRPIKAGCRAGDPTSWQCYFSSVKARDEATLLLTFAFDGDVSETQARNLANRAELAWFNFVGAKLPKLQMIIGYTSDGLDIGTTRRDQVPLLN